MPRDVIESRPGIVQQVSNGCPDRERWPIPSSQYGRELMQLGVIPVLEVRLTVAQVLLNLALQLVQMLPCLLELDAPGQVISVRHPGTIRRLRLLSSSIPEGVDEVGSRCLVPASRIANASCGSRPVVPDENLVVEQPAQQ